MIRCEKCDADLTYVTGDFTGEGAACPHCGHHRFEKWERTGYVGPGAE